MDDLGTTCRDALRRLCEQGQIASPWLPGMAWRVARTAPLDEISGRCLLPLLTYPYPGAVPDPTDPATQGCLLALVREAAGHLTISLVYCEPMHPEQACGWAMQWADSRLPLWGSDYDTEAEALVAALVALAGGDR